MNPWLLLAVAIGFEIGGTMLLKLSDGFARPALGMLAIGFYSASFWFFAPAIKTIPVGVAYAIWAGIGILAITLIGGIFFQQRLAASQYLFIALIIVGAVGLRLTTTAE